MRKSFFILIASAVLLVLTSSSAFAQFDDWNGGSGNWNTGTNWSTGSPPGSESGAAFDTGTGTVTVNSDTFPGNIMLFEGNAGSYVISGGPIYSPEDIQMGQYSYGTDITGSNITETINTPISILTPDSETYFTSNATNSSDVLYFGTTATISGPDSLTLILEGANTGANTIAGVISAGELDKDGAGTWILTGANTYSGVGGSGTYIDGGILQVGNGGTTGNLGSGGVQNGGSLVYDLSSTLVESNNIGQYLLGSGPQPGSVSQIGTGTLVLTGNNTYTGGTILSSGTTYVDNTSGSGTGLATVAVGSAATLAGTGAIRPKLVSSGYAVTVAGGGNITPGGVQSAPIYNGQANSGLGPSNAANGNLLLDPTSVTSGDLLSVNAGTVAKPSLTFAISNTVSGLTVTHSDSEIIVAGTAANIVDFNANGGGSSTVAINDLVGASLQFNLAYGLIQGNGNTTFEDDGSAWSSVGGRGLTALSGTISNLGTNKLYEINGGLSLLPANTSSNFFSQNYGSSVLIFDATTDSIDVEVVPEPATWALLLGGMAVLTLWRRQVRKV